MLSKRITIALVVAVMVVTGAVTATGCATRGTATVVATSAKYGEVLMKSIGAAQQAVIAGEATGLVERNPARIAVQRFVDTAALGEKAADKMDRLLAADAAGRAALIIEIASLLDQVSSGALSALVPIGNEQLRSQLTALIAEIVRTVATINREVLR
jgi:hypothetical protein